MPISYAYNDYPLPLVSGVQAPMPSRIASADTPGVAGEYPTEHAAARRLATRTVTVSGTLTANDYDALQEAWSELCAAHDTGDARKLVIRDGWYLYARAENVQDTKRDVTAIEYEITYRCSDPYFYSNTGTFPTISTSGGTFFVGGRSPALPRLTLVVSAAPGGGLITITNSTTGEICKLYPASAETLIVDSYAEAIYHPVNAEVNEDRAALLRGQFLTLLANKNNTLVIAASGGAALSSATVGFRARTV